MERRMPACDIVKDYDLANSTSGSYKAETTFKIIKTEFTKQYVFENLKHLQRELDDYVHWFNNRRIHSSIDYLTPVMFKNIHLKKLSKKCCQSTHVLKESIK